MSYHYGAISNVFRQNKQKKTTAQHTKYHPGTTVAPLKKKV